MKQRCRALFRGVESFVRRHLYMVCRRAIEGPVASDCDANAARLDDQIGLGNALDDRLRGLGLAKLGDSVELRSMEDDIGAEQRDGSPVFVVPPDFELLVEEDDCALFAFAHLPATRGRLPVAHPARIASECAGRHGERKRVDSAIGATRDGVHRPRACGAFLGIPGPPPGEHPVLELRDDGVRQLFVMVAPSDVVPQFLHWAVLSPFVDLNSPSRVASRSPLQGREAGTTRPAKRLGGRTLAAGDGDAIAVSSWLLLLVLVFSGTGGRAAAGIALEARAVADKCEIAAVRACLADVALLARLCAPVRDCEFSGRRLRLGRRGLPGSRDRTSDRATRSGESSGA